MDRVLSSNTEHIRRVKTALTVPLNAFSDKELQEAYKGLVVLVRLGIRLCKELSETVETEKEALEKRLARLEKQRVDIAAYVTGCCRCCYGRGGGGGGGGVFQCSCRNENGDGVLIL